MVRAQSPGFNEALLIEGARGNTRMQDVAVMYDLGLYLNRQGYGYLMADLLPFNEDGQLFSVASGDARVARVLRAEDLFRQSLQEDPANAFSWLYYTHALLKREDVNTARRTLERAWQLGPTSAGLAVRRRAMVATIRELTGEKTAYEEMLRRDTELLARPSPLTGDADPSFKDNPSPIGQ